MGMPDVCKTPPFAIPAPFPDIGNNAMCIPGYFTILTAGMPDLNLLSMYAITQGDEAGVMGGVVSQVFIGPARPVMGSQAVFVAGRSGVAPDRPHPAQPLQRAGLRRRPESDDQARSAVGVERTSNVALLRPFLSEKPTYPFLWTVVRSVS